MNIVDLVTKLGSFGLIIYIAVKLVPHVVGFLDEQRKALQTINTNVLETQNAIRATEQRLTSHTTEQANNVRHPLSERLTEVHTEVLDEIRTNQAANEKLIAAVHADSSSKYYSLRELILWFGHRVGIDDDEGSVPPPPQSERALELSGQEETLDSMSQRPSRMNAPNGSTGRPPSKRRTMPVS